MVQTGGRVPHSPATGQNHGHRRHQHPRSALPARDHRPREAGEALDRRALVRGSGLLSSRQYLVWSDIPNDRLMRYDETDGSVSVFWQCCGNHNGHTTDREGRLISCEHKARVVSRIEHDGSRTVLASHWQGKQLNSPNDVAQAKDGAFWFSDPTYGIDMDYEGDRGRERDRRLQRLPDRPRVRRGHGRGDRPGEAERPRLLPRRAVPVRGRHRPEPCAGPARDHHPLSRLRRRTLDRRPRRDLRHLRHRLLRRLPHRSRRQPLDLGWPRVHAYAQTARSASGSRSARSSATSASAARSETASISVARPRSNRSSSCDGVR